MLNLLQTKLVKQLEGFGYVQLYFEQLLPMFTLNEQLWKLYCGFATDLCTENEERIRILRCSLKNCYTCPELWETYLIELERQGNDKETINSVAEQAREQMATKSDACFQVDQFMLGYLTRQIPQQDQETNEERYEAISKLRQFYESKVIELT